MNIALIQPVKEGGKYLLKLGDEVLYEGESHYDIVTLRTIVGEMRLPANGKIRIIRRSGGFVMKSSTDWIADESEVWKDRFKRWCVFLNQLSERFEKGGGNG